jgi:hypothetical protein
VKGVPSPAKAYDRLATMLRNCDPPIEPTIGWVAVAPDQGVIYARMAPGRHLYKGVFYVRNGTATEVGTIEQLERAAPALARAVLPEQFSPPTAPRSSPTESVSNSRPAFCLIAHASFRLGASLPKLYRFFRRSQRKP